MVVDHDGCWKEGFPVVVCVAAKLKKPLAEYTVLLQHSPVKWMLRVVHNCLDFMKNLSLHHRLQRLHSRPKKKSSFFIRSFSFHKSLALMRLTQLKMTKDD